MSNTVTAKSIVIPRRGRHHRRGRRLRFRCRQGGFLSSPLLAEPLVPPVVWSLVFGFPAENGAKAIRVPGCTDDDIRATPTGE